MVRKEYIELKHCNLQVDHTLDLHKHCNRLELEKVNLLLVSRFSRKMVFSSSHFATKLNILALTIVAEIKIIPLAFLNRKTSNNNNYFVSTC